MKKILGALAGIVLLSSCLTLKPKGSIDIAYVPHRTDDKFMENEIMTELDAGLEAKVVEGKLKNAKMRIGGRQRTYSNPKHLFSFDPNRQEYDIYGNIRYKNFKLYIEHMCSHTVDGKWSWIMDEDGNPRFLDYDDITKIGVKLEW